MVIGTIYKALRIQVMLAYTLLVVCILVGSLGGALATNGGSNCPMCEYAPSSEIDQSSRPWVSSYQDIYAAQMAAQSTVTTQLGFALDGSGSITASNWDIILDGLANAIESNDFPKDGTVELTVVQFGVACPDGSGARIEIMPTVITANNYNTVISDIKNIGYGGWGTPMSCGLILLADAMSSSPNFDPGLKQIVNIITDGEPTTCCYVNSSYCGNDSQVCDPQSNSVDAKDYLKDQLQLKSQQDRITCEFIGSNTQYRDWLKDSIVWPQPGQIAPPYPTDSGWVRMISTFLEIKEAIQEKIKTIAPTASGKVNIERIAMGERSSLATGRFDVAENSVNILGHQG